VAIVFGTWIILYLDGDEKDNTAMKTTNLALRTRILVA